MTFDQIQLLESSITYNRPINAPFKKNEKLGQMLLKIPGKDDIYVPLVAEEDVKQLNFLFRFFSAIKYLIFGTSLDEN